MGGIVFLCRGTGGVNGPCEVSPCPTRNWGGREKGGGGGKIKKKKRKGILKKKGCFLFLVVLHFVFVCL